MFINREINNIKKASQQNMDIYGHIKKLFKNKHLGNLIFRIKRKARKIKEKVVFITSIRELKRLDSADWQKYIDSYPDLAGLTEKQAKEHWIIRGKRGGRILFAKCREASLTKLPGWYFHRGAKKNTRLLSYPEFMEKIKEPRTSDALRCIFIHVPRCAGSSVDMAVFGEVIEGFDPKRGIWMQHATSEQVKRFYSTKEKWDQYFKFSIVRNPFDRLVSSYKWICREAYAKKREKSFRDFIFGRGIFKYLLDPEKNKDPRNRYHQVMPAVDYFITDGKVELDLVCKFEELEKGWKKICDKIGTRIGLPHLNKTRGVSYRKYYDKETKEQVYSRYKKDIEKFGYDF